MAFFDSARRALGSLRVLSDSDLAEEREALCLEYVQCQDVIKATRLYNELHRYDEEMTRRANEADARENPDATARHREHGWYLSNDE